MMRLKNTYIQVMICTMSALEFHSVAITKKVQIGDGETAQWLRTHVEAHNHL